MHIRGNLRIRTTITIDSSKPSSALSAMDDLGMRSAWHHFRNEAFGRETVPTYFHRWKHTNGFHIDYAFASDLLQIASADLGNMRTTSLRASAITFRSVSIFEGGVGPSLSRGLPFRSTWTSAD